MWPNCLKILKSKIRNKLKLLFQYEEMDSHQCGQIYLNNVAEALTPYSVNKRFKQVCYKINITRRASSVSNSKFFYKTEGWRVKDGW